ncbi:glycerophosphoryl diester phosphodiesterase family protein [Streptomyces puniciscabiei]|uniref:Glycerophosphoryl diester phosphodiesterase family protein n=1 Tax=Streptomyces puniciscabiei TaxID=164348 RepID=A0A542UHY0_9ACTN|nr:glycerophosphoryl diester phosphodiesterase membrane domain-containing protein [Streptomyces puniciscabiei]TQK98644.1 glycerophosphoryl diester phosphodiesterase family protein [Streptomyces puniciscabiei]
MTDTPGWASPGTAPSNEGREPGASGPAEPGDRPGDTPPAPQPGAQPQGPGVKWSKEQPPPGQWSAPTGAPSPQQTPPPPPPGPGWTGQPPGGYGGGHGAPPAGYGGYGAPGGHGAWGGGWGGPPPAAKPGVIPLRPLGVGEILDGAVSTMRTHWRTVLGISLAVSLLLNTSMVLLQGFVLNDTTVQTTINDPNSASPDEALHALRETMIGTGIVSVIRTVAIILLTALLTTITSRAVLGRSVTVGEAWRESRPQILKLFGLLILLGLIFAGVALVGGLPGILLVLSGSTVGGAALLVLGFLAASVVALWLGIRFYLAAPALMLERQGIVKSLKRSAKLVRGSWWRTFGIVLLTMIITVIVASVISVPFALIGAAVSGDSTGEVLGTSGGHIGWTALIIRGIGALIGTTLTLPISAGVTVLLYIDQRIRREALDLELARAAGVQGTGGPGPVPGS